MNKTSIIVYWTDPDGPCSQDMSLLSLSEVSKNMDILRKTPGVRHVSLSTEMADNVGKPGVDSVVDGKTPDGQVYDWSKQDRAGKMRRGKTRDADPNRGKVDQ